MADNDNHAADEAAISTRRKQPSTGRKVTACIACRRLKIKCHMSNTGAPPCARCQKRGSPCSVDNSPRLLAEDDALWRASMTRKWRAYDDFMASTAQQLATIQAQLGRQGRNEPEQGNGRTPLPSTSTTGRGQASESPHVDEVRMEVESGPANIPSSSTSTVGESVPNRSTVKTASQDIISLGLLTVDQAHTLFGIYAHRLDHYLYRVLRKPSTLQETRKSSRVLLAAVCTVGALHCPELASSFDACYSHYRNVVADVALSKQAGLDDIRGLCIGAFWLRDISWNLSSIAVTLATQQHLHQHSVKNVSAISRELHERIRLYYLVYICDHHFSIAYGRPPMTSESALISSSRNFLDSPDSTEDDARLVSQVEIWSISTQSLNLLGFDVNEAVADDLIPPTRHLMLALDTWRANWSEEFGHNEHVGNYPRKGVKLHYHFARLYLCSHAFRGLDFGVDDDDDTGVNNLTLSGSPSHGFHHTSTDEVGHQSTDNLPLHVDLEEIAEAAIDSARAILRMITSDPEIQSHLNGLPLYFDTMIAFAIVFLFKVATRYSMYVRSGTSSTLDLIHKTAQTLKAAASDMHRRHFIVALASGVEKTLLKSHETRNRASLCATSVGPGAWQAGSVSPNSGTVVVPHAMPHQQEAGFSWTPEDFDWTNYDFLGNGIDFSGHLTGFDMNA